MKRSSVPAKPRREKSELEQKEKLEALMDEQVEGALKRASADPRKTSATWIGSGDFLILLLCDATSMKKPIQKRYTCRVLDLKTTGVPDDHA
jgi:hypothetical protein